MRYHTHYPTFTISSVWFGGYLGRVTTCYHQIYKNKYNYKSFFKKMVKTRGNAL